MALTELDKLYRTYLNGARARRLPFRLTEREFSRFISKPCYYCGALPRGGKFKWNGLDRVNNKLGYNYDNIVPCCAECNRMKMAMRQDWFLGQVKRVYEHLKLRRYEAPEDVDFQIRIARPVGKILAKTRKLRDSV